MKPKRRTCDHECPHWRKWQDRGDPGLCALGEPDAYTIPGDLCNASDAALRKCAAADPAGWEAEELRARGLKP